VGAARWIVLVVALLLAGLSVARLEGLRAGLETGPLPGTGTTPATYWMRPGAGDAPVVVIAHGFAGSRQLMEGFALTLARAGYIAVTFDFEGHGRNPVPMSGDVTSVAGTTQLLMDETGRVTDAALSLPGASGEVALVGHSMASDIVVRQAIADDRVGAVVAVSMFSEAVSATQPARLLVVTGEWEGRLADEALRALRLVDPAGTLGTTVTAPGVERRAVLAPSVEHVGVLFAPTTLRETQDWLDATFGRDTETAVAARGPWVALLLVSVVALGWPLAGWLGRWRAEVPPPRIPAAPFWTAVLAAAVATPLVLWPFDTAFLPVLVADYLALHFAVYGVLALGVLFLTGGLQVEAVPRVLAALAMAVPVAVFGILVFGTALDRYVASFWPTPERLGIVLAIACGAVPFFLADAVLTEGGRGGVLRVLAARGASLGSLAGAVALDFEGLFFLVIILPVIVLFFLLFGTVGGWIGRASWRPGAAGIGLGLFLAWALGVSFPLFAG
jgi:hypothetical protein